MMEDEFADEHAVEEEGEEEQPVTWKEAIRHSKLPILVWLVFITTFFACTFGGAGFLGYSVAGYAWIICFAFAVMVIPANFDRISFPLSIWLPWMLFVAISGYMSDYTNLQRSALLLCPIVVGVASSTARVDEKQIINFSLLVKVFSLAVLVLAFFLTGLLITGQLPSATALAPQAITATVLAAFFASGYSFGRVKDLFWWSAIALMPVVALTRMAIFATGLSLPATFSPMKLQTRAILIVVVALLGLALFYSPRVQEKMFMKGEGTLSDITDPNNLATSGRRYMAGVLLTEISQKPIWGHGANASEDLILKLTEGRLTHPHDDWLRFLYDYGAVGTALFLFTLIIQVRHLLKKARHSEGEIRVLFFAAASTFLPFVLMMFTDNIVLYAAFYGNLQFTILGLAYSAEKRSRLERVSYEGEEFYRRFRRTSRSLAYREDGETKEDAPAAQDPSGNEPQGGEH
ncbi:MAG TPA: O-antigen ligase family protein [Bacteroidota bacterium]|nr:O-antigen ligase family protein [Bacteroidota bacterium]